MDDKHKELETPNLRYKIREAAGCNTRIIMEAKLWACRVLELVCTMRLDIRLSHMLAHYKVGRYVPLCTVTYRYWPFLRRPVP